MSLDSRLRNFRSEDEPAELDRSLAAVRVKARRTILIRRAGMAALVAAVIAAAVTIPIAVSDRETPEPIGPGPAPSPSVSFHPATPTGQAKSIAYIDQQDLWVYDVRTDRSTRLTHDGNGHVEGEPVFYGDRYVLFRSTDPLAIQAIPLDGGASTTIVQEQGIIFDFDAAPDGSSIVYIQADFDGDATHRLKRVAVGGGAPVVLRALGTPPGRGAGSEDEVSVEWSPDGRSILVTDTHVDSDPTQLIRLLDASGRDVIAAWSGTHARWSPDGKTIYYRGHADQGDSRWRMFDVATKAKRTIGFREGSNNLVISPDGTQVAYDTSWFGDTPRGAILSKEAPAVYVYELRRGTETLLKKGSVFALWIAPNGLIATDARLPKPGTSLNSWEPIGTASKLGLDGTRKRVSIKSTAWDNAGILFDI